MVARALELAKVTGPGAAAAVHQAVKGAGRLSSVTAPARASGEAVGGAVPASTRGAGVQRHDAELGEGGGVEAHAAGVVAIESGHDDGLHEDRLRLAELDPGAGHAGVVGRVQRGHGVAAADEAEPALLLGDAGQAAGAALGIGAPDVAGEGSRSGCARGRPSRRCPWCRES